MPKHFSFLMLVFLLAACATPQASPTPVTPVPPATRPPLAETPVLLRTSTATPTETPTSAVTSTETPSVTPTENAEILAAKEIVTADAESICLKDVSFDSFTVDENDVKFLDETGKVIIELRDGMVIYDEDYFKAHVDQTKIKTLKMPKVIYRFEQVHANYMGRVMRLGYSAFEKKYGKKESSEFPTGTSTTEAIAVDEEGILKWYVLRYSDNDNSSPVPLVTYETVDGSAVVTRVLHLH